MSKILCPSIEAILQKSIKKSLPSSTHKYSEISFPFVYAKEGDVPRLSLESLPILIYFFTIPVVSFGIRYNESDT